MSQSCRLMYLDEHRSGIRTPGRGTRFIAVAGNIGAGKSSLVKFITTNWNVKPFFEPNEVNPFLTDFYQDMQRWAFHSQISFLAKRLALHQQLVTEPGVVVQDRTIYEDAEIFARNLHLNGHMTKREYDTYFELYQAIVATLPSPDLLIYLRCSVNMARKRIRYRGRPEEQSIPRAYITTLHDLYEDWFSRWNRSDSLVIEMDTLDWKNDLIHRAELIESINNLLKTEQPLGLS